MRGSARTTALLWFPAVRARISGVPLAGTLCTRFSVIVMPTGGVQLTVYMPGCGPLDFTWRLVGPATLGVVVPADELVVTVRMAVPTPGTASVLVAVGPPTRPMRVLVGISVAVAVGTAVGT